LKSNSPRLAQQLQLMGGQDHASPVAGDASSGGPSESRARHVPSNRIGVVLCHDPSDSALSYKLQFDDGKQPAVDWYPESQVEKLHEADGSQAVPEKLSAFEIAKRKMQAEQAAQDWEGRVKSTPVADEAFICMGTKAPLCPAPAPRQSGGPVTLEVLQGAWVASGGVQIVVLGTAVLMNGLPLQAHPVQLNDDGMVMSIGSLWQFNGWTEDGGLDFRCSSTREGMDCAKSEIWRRRDGLARNEAAEAERLRLMGYAGSAANPLARGVEGCMPGTMGAELSSSAQAEKDAKDIALLSALISQWRETDLCRIRSRLVVPDITNRAQTGLGVELMHFVASSMQAKGFQKRKGTQGHDIPVVVREPPGDFFHSEALRIWRERVAEEEGFPPVRATDEEEIFTSLGNGHFFQALNCFACQHPRINEEGCYNVGQDANLSDALEAGVPSIVLRHETPRPVRAKIAELLNSKREFMWTLGEDGKVDVSKLEENTSYCSQFEWLSKGMDAEQVNCLVRTHLGIKDSKRIQG